MKPLNQMIILCDCDNTVLNWEYAFHVWMETKGYKLQVDDPGLIWNMSDKYGLMNDHVIELIEQFNRSASIGFLPAFRDSHEYIRKLHRDHGYEFHAVTSFTDDKDAFKLRKMNLEKVFSPGVFTHIEAMSIGKSKQEYLSKFKDSGCFWIEDLPKHAIAGLEVGLKPILIEHGYNMDFVHPQIPVLKNWSEIYNMIINL